MRWPSLVLATALIMLSFSGVVAHASTDDGFDQWLASFKARAAEQGIPAPVIEDAFAGIEPDDQVVELDRKQPENKVSLQTYLRNTITPRRVRQGKAFMAEHRELLGKISARYHVPPKYIVALWGIESDFGNNKGNFSVVQSLATLAYEGRRADFFANQLMAALKILAKENMPSSDLSGSWAGAMGDCQFMPTTYLDYAADGDGDGKRDIWNNPADIFASIANYLHSLGWQRQTGWGYAVRVPKNFTAAEADIKHAETFKHWRKRGLTYADGKPLPKSQALRYAIYPGAEEDGVYLVTENYQAILQWNRSRYFATAVGMLADQIGD